MNSKNSQIFFGPSSIDKLKILNLKSLEVQYLGFELLLTYKIIFHLNNLDVDMFFHI